MAWGRGSRGRWGGLGGGWFWGGVDRGAGRQCGGWEPAGRCQRGGSGSNRAPAPRAAAAPRSVPPTPPAHLRRRDDARVRVGARPLEVRLHVAAQLPRDPAPQPRGDEEHSGRQIEGAVEVRAHNQGVAPHGALEPALRAFGAAAVERSPFGSGRAGGLAAAAPAPAPRAGVCAFEGPGGVRFLAAPPFAPRSEAGPPWRQGGPRLAAPLPRPAPRGAFTPNPGWATGSGGQP
jgi:hypothetical protein